VSSTRVKSIHFTSSPTSEVFAFAVLLLPTVGNHNIQRCGGFHWYGEHRKFCIKSPKGFKVEMGVYKDTPPLPTHTQIDENQMISSSLLFRSVHIPAESVLNRSVSTSY